MGDTSDFDANLDDLLTELATLNVHQANIENATLSIDRPSRYNTGSPLFIEQWDHGSGVWVASFAGTNGSSQLSDEKAYSKGHCWLLRAGSDGFKRAKLQYYLGRYEQVKIGYQWCFTLDGDMDYFWFCSDFVFGDNCYAPQIFFDLDTGQIYIVDEKEDYVYVDESWVPTTTPLVYHFVKLIVNMETGYYDKLYFDDVEVDLAATRMFGETGYSGENWFLEFRLHGLAGKNPSVYVDDICITREG